MEKIYLCHDCRIQFPRNQLYNKYEVFVGKQISPFPHRTHVKCKQCMRKHLGSIAVYDYDVVTRKNFRTVKFKKGMTHLFGTVSQYYNLGIRQGD